MKDKNYFFAPNLPTDLQLLKKICHKFTKKSFLTNSKLFLNFKSVEEMIGYVEVWSLDGNFCSNIVSVLEGHSSEDQWNEVVDCYISGAGEENSKYLELARRFGKEIFDSAQENIFEDIYISDEVKNFRKTIEDNVEKEIFSKYPLGEYDYILAQLDFGEAMPFYFWSKAYKEIFPHKKILCLCCEPFLFDMMSNSPYVDVSVSMHKFMYKYLAVFFADSVKNLNFAPFVFAGNQTNRPHLIGMEQKILNIPPEVPFPKFDVVIQAQDLKTANYAFNYLQLEKSRTVFFELSGGYYNADFLAGHFDFWQKLAESFKAQGYQVVVHGEGTIITGCPSINLTIPQTAAFVQYCGNVVGVPSGFLECVCSFTSKNKIKAQLVLPNAQDSFWQKKFYAWQIEGLSVLQHWGKNFVESRIKFQSEYVKFFWGDNVDFVFHQWKDLSGADLGTVEKILNYLKK